MNIKKAKEIYNNNPILRNILNQIFDQDELLENTKINNNLSVELFECVFYSMFIEYINKKMEINPNQFVVCDGLLNPLFQYKIDEYFYINLAYFNKFANTCGYTLFEITERLKPLLIKYFCFSENNNCQIKYF